MDSNHLAFELGRAGCQPGALEDGLRRAEHYFLAHTYSPEAATTWCQAQRQEAAHSLALVPPAACAEAPVWTTLGLTKEEFRRLPAPGGAWPEGREHQPPPVHSRRPQDAPLTAEELTTLEGLSWAERQTKGREMQQSPEPR